MFKDKPGFKPVVYLVVLSVPLPHNVMASSDRMIVKWEGFTVLYSGARSSPAQRG